MKNLVLLTGLVLVLFSCKKKNDDDRKLLDISFRSNLTNTFTIPKMADQPTSLPEQPVEFPLPETPNTLPDELRKNNLNPDKIRSVKVEALDMKIKSPAGQTLDFIKRIEVYLGSKGKSEILIASKDNIHLIDPPATSVSLDVQNTNIVEYVKAPTYYLKIKTVLVKATTQEIEAESATRIVAVINPVQ